MQETSLVATSETNRSAERWAVVGGGMLGLTMAHRLSQLGQDVTILEGADELGGLASPWQLGELTWDRHYHVTLLSDTHLRGVLDEIGLEKEMKWVETKTGFFTNGKLHSMSNTAEFLSFPPLSLLEKLRLGFTIFYGSKIKNWKRLEKQTVESWLRRWSGNGTFEKIWEPLLKAKLGETYKRTSASFIWSYISRMYKARRTGLKKEMFGYVPGGYAKILDRFEEVLTQNGVEIRLGAKVQNVQHRQGQVHVSLENENLEFDKLVFTTPAPIVAHACPDLTPDEKHRFQDVDYLGIVCASVLLKKPISKYYVTNITDPVPITAVIEMTTIVDKQELGGHDLVYLPKYVHRDDPIFERTDQDIEEEFLSTIENMYPEFSRDDVVAFRISRVRNVMALPTLRYSEKLPPMQTSIPGVFAVTSSHIVKGNLNVNETIDLAEEGLRDVLMKHINVRPK